MGAIAVFTEKYGKIVRVVSIGDYSIEFDGGTHVKNSSELGLFKIVSETGIGAGTRRIEAVTSKEAFELLAGEEQTLKQVAAQVKAPKLADTPAKVSQLQADLKAEQQNRASLESRLAKQQAGAVFDQVDDVNGTTLIAQQIEVSGMDQLRQLADTWKTKQYSDVLVLGTVIGEKVNLLVAVSDDKVKAGIKAGDLIKAIAPKVGGGGGGRPTLAQAGGKKPAGLPAALKNRASLESRLAKQQAGAVFDQVDDVNGTTLIAQQIEVSGMDQLRQLADTWKTKQYSDVLVLGTVIGEKVNLLVAVSDDKVKAGIKAGDLIKAIAPKVGGGGGGRPTLAQAGGKKPAGLPAALKAAHEWLAEQ
ncbi:hypothetical protein WP50_30635 [Lactiplantibacillus plantarum]|nr:hypothetical protein WP50_30635 [Lactiplantibacillus plantarum]